MATKYRSRGAGERTQAAGYVVPGFGNQRKRTAVSQFRVSVCLPPGPPGGVAAALAAALAPFDMNRPATGNPDGRWDWWHIGAGDEFAVKPRHDGDPLLIHQPAWPGGAPRERLPLRCDGGPRGLLDFEATRASAIAGARDQWQAEQQDWQRLVASHPPALPLSAFLARNHADPQGYTREQAIADHHRQPLIRALSGGRPTGRYPNLALWILCPGDDPISYYTRDPQADLDLAAAWAIPTFALLTTDGQWLDADQPGPFGHARPGEDRSGAYARQATAYLDGLDGDCVIVRLLCHG